MEIKKCLSILLIIILSLSNCNLIQGANVQQTVQVTKDDVTRVRVINELEQVVENIIPFYYTNDNDLKQSLVRRYKIFAPKGYVEDLYIPVTIDSPGVLLYNVVPKHETKVTEGDYSLCANQEGTKVIKTQKNRAYIEKAGTYYLKISSKTYSTSKESKYIGIFGFVRSKGVTLKKNIRVVSASISEKKALYYKIVAKNDAQLSLKVASDGKAAVTLCDKKKRELLKPYKINRSKEMVYALQKGTYFIKIKASKGFLTVEESLKVISNKAGNNKKSAETVKLNHNLYSGLVFANDNKNKEYWFKFENNEQQKIYMDVSTDFTLGSVKMEVISSEGKNFGSTTFKNGLKKSKSFQLYSTSEKGKVLPKGTYFIKFTKTGKQACGILGIRIKKK